MVRPVKMRSMGIVVAVSVYLTLAAPVALAIELEPATIKAYTAYLERAQRTFLSRVAGAAPAPPSDGVATGRPGQEDGIIGVPGGLIHHWVGTAYIRGATLRDVLNVSQAYAAYSTVHESVIASRVLAREGNTYRVLMRLKEGEAGITAILDVRSTVRYVHPSSRSAYALSNSEEIREVQNADTSEERLLPVGNDSGYLWRASTFTRFVQLDGGVYVEMETLGLSRRFPRMLGWIIEPIARRIGRKSVEQSLREFVEAVRAAPAR